MRTDLQFDDAHIPGAVCITMIHAGFGTKLAWVADRDQEIVLVGRDDADGRNAARLATAVGIRKLGGFLAGGMTSWRAERRETGCVERLTVPELAERSDADPDLQILDVREEHEWREGHIAGSLHTPYHDIHELPAEVDPSARWPRSAPQGSAAPRRRACSRRMARADVLHVVDGGVAQWKRLGRPTESGP